MPSDDGMIDPGGHKYLGKLPVFSEVPLLSSDLLRSLATFKKQKVNPSPWLHF